MNTTPLVPVHQSGDRAIHTVCSGEVLYMGSRRYECQACRAQCGAVPAGVKPRRFVWRAEND